MSHQFFPWRGTGCLFLVCPVPSPLPFSSSVPSAVYICLCMCVCVSVPFSGYCSFLSLCSCVISGALRLALGGRAAVVLFLEKGEKTHQRFWCIIDIFPITVLNFIIVNEYYWLVFSMCPKRFRGDCVGSHFGSSFSWQPPFFLFLTFDSIIPAFFDMPRSSSTWHCVICALA